MTSSRLALAKPYALGVVTTHSQMLQKHFLRFATRKYRCKPQQVSFECESQLELLKRAALGVCGEGNLGETDGVSITVNEALPMSFDELVATLVHEYLHNFCRVRGKFMSCDNEHSCMRGLEKF